MPFSLQARVVFPVDRPPIENGVVTIDGDRIVAVSKEAEHGEVTDLGSVALLPGLVNAHTHLEFSHLRQPLGQPGIRLVDWIQLVIAERGRSAISAANSIAAGLSESIHFGVTTIGDIAGGRTDNPVRPCGNDGQEYPSYRLPGRTSFLEVIGFSGARANSALAALVEKLALQHSVAQLRLGISPHAPYTVSPQLLGELVAVARDRELPIAMHLAESQEELELLRDGTGPFQELLDERSMWDAEAIPRGSRPLGYLRSLAEAPRGIVIHGNYLDDEELAFLGARRELMSLIYCPRTHAYFQHAAYPLAKALGAGVRVALGTDSRASNPDLNLLSEMRHVARTHPAIDTHDILHMGTLAGAEALGRADEVGSITPSKRANLVAVPLAEDARGTPRDLLAAILASDEGVSSVWINGKPAREDPLD